WHLYNITEDPGETEPLETVETTAFFDLLAEYESYARENGVIPVPKNYHQPVQILRNGLKARFKNSISSPTGLLIISILGTMIILLMARKLTRQSP
ncbi:MAG: arylsulfatase, partial [Rhodobacteraceae bacterium]|nr:arylsulfatase [Paracoccaceae bacterium]